MLYSLAILPPPSLALPLAALRTRLDPAHAPITTPHVTLKQPFHLPGAEASGDARLLEAVRAVCRRMPAFSLTLTDVSMFESAVFGGVVHLGVVLDEPLAALQFALVTAVAELGVSGFDPAREVRLYYPHLTVAQGKTAEDARAAVAALSPVPEQTFVVTELVIGCCGDDAVWRISHVLPLSGRVTARLSPQQTVTPRDVDQP